MIPELQAGRLFYCKNKWYMLQFHSCTANPNTVPIEHFEELDMSNLTLFGTSEPQRVMAEAYLTLLSKKGANLAGR
ncbi:MAG: hypothetical protein ACM3SY_02275 [Candidatus Omnitrophota bacterium]